MPTSSLALLVLIFTSVFYLVQAILVVFLRKGNVWRWLLVFLSFNLVWGVIMTLILGGIIPVESLDLATPIGLLVTTSSLLAVTRAALKDERPIYLWLIGGLIWLGVIILGALGLLQNWRDLSLGISGLSWLVFMIGIAQSIIRARRYNPTPLIRARTYYWSIGVIITAMGEVILIGGQYPIGVFLMGVGSIILTTTSLRPYMPDIRQMEQSVLNYLVMTILTALVLIIGAIGIVSLIIKAQQSYSPAFIAAVIAFIIAALLAPLWSISHRIARRLLPQGQYDTERIIREFSQSVSNIFDPEKLSTISIHLITAGMEITHGFLFLVEQESDEGITQYRLRSPKNSSTESQEIGMIATSSPLVQYFRQECKPLRQIEYDFQSRFKDVSREEFAWLHSLKVELFIPIIAKDEWIGLFALGPKMNGLPYLEKDITILTILADQTSIALQNARLVESLMRVNNEFRRAYAAMDQANRHLKKVNTQLEGLDRTKTEFINVATQELQNPLNDLRGYTEALLDDPVIQDNPAQGKLVDGIYTGIMRMHEIVNSMVDIANIDNRTMELRLEHVSISTLIHTIQKSLANAVKERNQTLEATNLSDLPPVDGDSAALYKVFYQVIINAIKYTPDGGKITITGVPVSAGQLGMVRGGVEILISDSGIGISRENLELIFTKFYQAGNVGLPATIKTKFKAPGPGLGLAIAKGIVEAHRGQIWAESPGLDEVNFPGSTIHVVLPLHYKSQPLPTE